MSDSKKYQCPNCGNHDPDELSATQLAWVSLRVGEYEDGTHNLEDGEVSDEYIGNVHLECQLCGTQWQQPEVTL